jgi:hypothetical protein
MGTSGPLLCVNFGFHEGRRISLPYERPGLSRRTIAPWVSPFRLLRSCAAYAPSSCRIRLTSVLFVDGYLLDGFESIDLWRALWALCFVAWPTRRRKWYTTCLCSAWNSVTVFTKRWDIGAFEWRNPYSFSWDYSLKWHRMEVAGQPLRLIAAVGCEWWAGRYIGHPDPFYWEDRSVHRRTPQVANQISSALSQTAVPRFLFILS